MMTQTPKPIALFPDIPRDRKMIDENGNLADIWRLYFDQFTLAIQTLFKTEGIVVPQLSAANIAMLTGTFPIGSTSVANIVYDSTNNLFKGNIAGTWMTFTLT